MILGQVACLFVLIIQTERRVEERERGTLNQENPSKDVCYVCGGSGVFIARKSKSESSDLIIYYAIDSSIIIYTMHIWMYVFVIYIKQSWSGFHKYIIMCHFVKGKCLWVIILWKI